MEFIKTPSKFVVARHSLIDDSKLKEAQFSHLLASNTVEAQHIGQLPFLHLCILTPAPSIQICEPGEKISTQLDCVMTRIICGRGEHRYNTDITWMTWMTRMADSQIFPIEHSNRRSRLPETRMGTDGRNRLEVSGSERVMQI
jgi:hypothetical protein